MDVDTGSDYNVTIVANKILTKGMYKQQQRHSSYKVMYSYIQQRHNCVVIMRIFILAIYLSSLSLYYYAFADTRVDKRLSNSLVQRAGRTDPRES